MNREIKFRGKRIDNGEWIYGYYYFNDSDNSHRIIVSTVTMQYGYEVIPETVGQYTELKDADGKETFDGDIYKSNWSKSNLYVVSYMNGSACGSLPHSEIKEPLGWDTEYEDPAIRPSNTDWFRVVGNIHDNPELLKIQ